MTRRTRSSERTADPRHTLVLALVALLAVAGFAAAAFYRDNPLVTHAQAYAEDVAKASGVTYVSLRAVNAFLSTAQEVQVSGGIVVGGSAQPFKFLEPIDDTIERIASLVFATMVVTGLLAVAMGPVSAVGAVLIGGAACLWLADRLLGRRDLMQGLVRPLGWYGIFLGFALPVAFLLSSLVADSLTERTWTRNNAIVQEITAPVAPDEAADASGLWGTLDAAGKYRDLASNIYNRADELIGSYVAILSVFLFKILILPLMLTGAAFAVMRSFSRGG